MRRLILACCLITAPAMANTFTVENENNLAGHESWETVCSNLNTCEMYGINSEEITEDAPDLPYLHLTLPAGPEAKPRLWLSNQSPNNPHFTVTPTTLLIALPKLKEFKIMSYGNADGDEGEIILKPGEVNALLKAMSKGDELSVVGKKGEYLGVIPLDGMAQHLEYVERAQGRVSTTTAWVQVGSNPSSTVPAMPALPKVLGMHVPAGLTIKTDIAADLRRHLKSRNLLEEECAPDPGLSEEDEAYPLSPSQTLVMLNCGMGAYQGSSQLWLVNGANVSGSIPFPLLKDDNKPLPQGQLSPLSHAPELTEPSFNPSTSILSTASRGRGIGDCGEALEYLWTGQAFREVKHVAKSVCQGGMAAWPLLYQAEVVFQPVTPAN